MQAHRNFDRELVEACLAADGDLSGCLEPRDKLTARWLGDGLGLRSITDPSHKSALWSWPHVRDSSDCAVRSMASFLRAVLHGNGIDTDVTL